MRDIATHAFDTLESLRKDQVSDNTVSASSKFPLWYFYKSEKRWLQNDRDLRDALDLLKQNDRLTLWCLGLTQVKK